MWRYEQRGTKLTKVPCNGYGQPISITQPPFYTYVQAQKLSKQKEYGLGLVFTGDGLVGIDMDHVLEEDTTNAMYWVHQFASYTELSPSRTGLHILVEGEIPGPRRRKGRYEIYSDKRFFTFTGDVFMYDTIKQVNLIEFYSTVIDPPQPQSRRRINIPAHNITTTSLVLDHLRSNTTFSSLYYGSILGYDSYSEAELALCSIVAKVTPDAHIIDSVMRNSYLLRDKWDSKRGEETYGEWTIRKALN